MFRLPWSRRPSTSVEQGAVSIVLQATESHAWAVADGWVSAARELGVLGEVIAPRAQWGAKDVEDDGGLAAYLARAGPGEIALLMGADWHSQMLHRRWRWRRRWRRTRAKKILYMHESIASARRLTGSDAMERMFRSAAELCDAILFADLADRPLVEAAGKPCAWQPFGVDTGLFRSTTPYAGRVRGAFFRGKVKAFVNEKEYAERRRLLETIRKLDLVEVISYSPGLVKPERLVEDFNRYQIAVNLPSVFAGHPTRVLEGMACGCCVVTNRTGVSEIDALFRDGADVLYYRDEAELVAAIRRARDDPEAAGAIAERARRTAVERFSLTRLLSEALTWARGIFRASDLSPRQGRRTATNC